MRFGIVGGDMRFAHLAQMLREEGRSSADFLQEKAGGDRRSLEELKNCDCVVANWPMKWPLSDQSVTEAEIMEKLASGTVLLLCGPSFPDERRWDLQYVDLWKDEALLCENAYLTAEGAVAAVAARLSRPMRGARCLVAGYGRIGRALTDILLRLEADVSVASRSGAKLREIASRGAKPVDMAQLQSALQDTQALFSTPPSRILDETALQKVNPDALILDLSSPPYGVDLDAAHRLGLKAWREPGLPGRYCPLSAARILYQAIVRWEERENA